MDKYMDMPHLGVPKSKDFIEPNENTVTQKQVDANMKQRLIRTEMEFGKPVTYVTVKMCNGFTIRESTTCVDPTNYSEKIGSEICLNKLENKVWFLLGYALQDKLEIPENTDIKSESCNEFNEKRIAEVMEISAVDSKMWPAPIKTERYDEWVEVIVGIGTDHTAYLTMTKTAYNTLIERKHQRDLIGDNE